MQINQQLNDKPKLFRRTSFRQRLTAGLVFLVMVVLFGLLVLAAHGKIDIDHWINPCGFKQKYALPCPTCGMTTSALAFVQGEIFEAFYIQPAAALLCSVVTVSAFLAFLTAVFGVYCGFFKQVFTEVKITHIVLALIIIIAASWAVTLARAVAANGQG